MNPAKAPALVDTAWLAAHLGDVDIHLVDSSFHLPGVSRDARAEYLQCHIPGAVFFDIDEVCDPQSTLPHMLPEAREFARQAARLGFSDSAHIVAYDVYGMASAPRLWWMLRVFGHDRVSVLEGGLPKWLEEERVVADGPVTSTPGEFHAERRDELVVDLDQVLAALQEGDPQIVDARPSARFAGKSEEPRPGLRLGHMPGALNVPWTDLLERGELRAPAELEQLLREAHVDRERPIVATCGSGVTACVLALGLYQLGNERVAVYDGSWAEWAARDDTPIVC